MSGKSSEKFNSLGKTFKNFVKRGAKIDFSRRGLEDVIKNIKKI